MVVFGLDTKMAATRGNVSPDCANPRSADCLPLLRGRWSCWSDPGVEQACSRWSGTGEKSCVGVGGWAAGVNAWAAAMTGCQQDLAARDCWLRIDIAMRDCSSQTTANGHKRA